MLVLAMSSWTTAAGPAPFAYELAPHVRRIHAIDTSAKMIEIAKSKAEQRGFGNVDFAQATVFDPNYEHGAVSVVLAINVLHLLPSTGPAVRRIAELLQRGGLFISATPCLGERMTLGQRGLVRLFAVLTKLGLVPYIKVSDSRELDGLITAEGALQIVETETLVHGIPNRLVVARKV
jgi:2-polyprenyl-3-methyl-5-hydroxy-6-metoxy-1,4-benzoquinol methylase